ncbi:MAG: hypothetical protein AB7K86_09955 [Rhodospirillales bacterium]
MNLFRLAAAAVLVVSAAAGPAAAQGAFAGAWRVEGVRPAPWLDGPAAQAVRGDPAIDRATVTFHPGRVEGPRPLACRAVKYEVKQVEAGYLFQGGLTDPPRQAAALGFSAGPIMNLTTYCGDDTADTEIDYALVDPGTAVFALDNVIYRLRKVR